MTQKVAHERGWKAKLKKSLVVNTPTTSSTSSIGKAQLIDWLVASPCRGKGDTHTSGTQVKSYSSFLWASRQLIWYLIEMNGWAKFKQQDNSGLTLQPGSGCECQPSLYCNCWHKSQHGTAFSALYKTPVVVYPCQPPNENIVACRAWKKIKKALSRSSVCVLRPAWDIQIIFSQQ